MVVGEEARTAIVGHYQALEPAVPGPDPPGPPRPGSRRDLSGDDWPDVDDGIGRANRDSRSGAELMGAGLVLPGERHEAAGRGDFWARLFVLEAD